MSKLVIFRRLPVLSAQYDNATNLASKVIIQLSNMFPIGYQAEPLASLYKSQRHRKTNRRSAYPANGENLAVLAESPEDCFYPSKYIDCHLGRL